jgi:sec-independent protein translocase protein TatA
MIGLENPLHIAIILIVVLMVFGAKRLPEMGKSLGSGLRGFKESLSTDGPAPSLMSEHTASVEREPEHTPAQAA